MKGKKLSSMDTPCMINQLDVFKALANPTRIDILKFLHNGPSCVSLVGLKLGVEQSNLSKHLLILKRAGLIDCRGKGAKHCYFICRPSLMGPLLNLLEQHHNYVPCTKPEQN